MNKILIVFFSLLLISHAKEIKLGMSADLSGPISNICISMDMGIRTYLHKNNNNPNKKYSFSLITYDDNYNAVKASKNVEKLIYDDNVLALLANMGTPPSKLTIPITNQANIAAFGFYTGGKYVRKEIADHNVFNYRISYKEEVVFIISNLLNKGIKPEEIVFLSQNDAYGNSGYFAAIEELKKRGFKNLDKIPNGRYNSHSLNVESALSELLDYPTQPKVILMFAITKPIIKFMKLAKYDFPDSTFISISPISRPKIIEQLKDLSNGLIITQTVPSLSSHIPIVEEFLIEFKKHYPNQTPSSASLEGYIVARLFIDSLSNSQTPVTDKESIIKILSQTKDLDIGLGFKSGFNKKYNQYSSKIWTSVINNGTMKEYDWDSLGVKK